MNMVQDSLGLTINEVQDFLFSVGVSSSHAMLFYCYFLIILIQSKNNLHNREYLALNVYVALCYYKLDYYDVSQEVLAVYLQHYPDSPIAINLKACNHFRLYNGKAAEQELRALQVSDFLSTCLANYLIWDFFFVILSIFLCKGRWLHHGLYS